MENWHAEVSFGNTARVVAHVPSRLDRSAREAAAVFESSDRKTTIRLNSLATEPTEGQILPMPLRYSIDSQRRRIRIVAEGALVPKDYQDFFGSFSIERREGALDCLSDYRAVELSASSNDMQAIARILGAHADYFRGRNAVVVPNKASYGMARMFNALAEPYGLEVRIFERIEDAEAYLDQCDDKDD